MVNEEAETFITGMLDNENQGRYHVRAISHYLSSFNLSVKLFYVKRLVCILLCTAS